MCLFVQQYRRCRHVSISIDLHRSHVRGMLIQRTCFLWSLLRFLMDQNLNTSVICASIDHGAS